MRSIRELGFDTDFPFHDLRHTYASHLAMRGMHIRALQELLGHKTLAMTLTLFPPGPGAVAECGEATGWGNWGKAEVNRVDTRII